MKCTIKLLAKAFRNRFEMNENDAMELARTVKMIFNGNKEIEDSSIDKHVRSLLYDLQKERFVKVRREEGNEKNKWFRRYFWYLDMNKIREEAKREIEEDPGKIYRFLPKKVWLSRSKD